ncbi:hypothetical protein [Gimesia chilikensis]|jgi:hypothetical protein|uniref:hypothetical protein n=1 Tax=Gimesia chilikensis TaxID=2605989 RepID=UPI00118BE65A|nr:hypothetical protein [Gimesia chilikensis]MCR9229633.1 hypothetical protein [bacterium]QDT84538.1 hypothetical protein MalM14_21980 [Gimesia chilikensis]
MSDPQQPVNYRLFIPLMMIFMSGYLFMKGPSSNTAQLLFRVGTLAVGLMLLLFLNLPKSKSNEDRDAGE